MLVERRGPMRVVSKEIRRNVRYLIELRAVRSLLEELRGNR